MVQEPQSPPEAPPSDPLLEQSPFADYTEDKTDEKLPVTSYVALIGTYKLLFIGFLLLARKMGRPLPERVVWSDILLLSLATQKLSRVITRNWVAIPVRAAFTEYQGPAETPAEVKEKPRGRGVQRVIGELLTCPFCIGTWIAALFSYSFVLWPRPARLLGGIFAITSISDFLHFIYVMACNKAEQED